MSVCRVGSLVLETVHLVQSAVGESLSMIWKNEWLLG